jgi:UDPglucose 6-dehydrogenase
MIEINNWQRDRFVQDVVRTMFDTLQNKKISVFGFAFKADTGDARESSAIYGVNLLIQENAKVSIYDPQVTKEKIYDDLLDVNSQNTREVLERKVIVYSDPYQCAKRSHAILILTEWPVFQTYDYTLIYDTMVKPAFLFDG